MKFIKKFMIDLILILMFSAGHRLKIRLILLKKFLRNCIKMDILSSKKWSFLIVQFVIVFLVIDMSKELVQVVIMKELEEINVTLVVSF